MNTCKIISTVTVNTNNQNCAGKRSFGYWDARDIYGGRACVPHFVQEDLLVDGEISGSALPGSDWFDVFGSGIRVMIPDDYFQ